MCKKTSDSPLCGKYSTRMAGFSEGADARGIVALVFRGRGAYASRKITRGRRELTCPHCGSEACRRSRRRGAVEYMIGVTRIRPWRCGECDTRFFGWSVAIPHVRYAHCSRCGNFGVKVIANEYGEGRLGFLWRLFRVPAYRCAPCRN